MKQFGSTMWLAVGHQFTQMILGSIRSWVKAPDQDQLDNVVLLVFCGTPSAKALGGTLLLLLLPFKDDRSRFSVISPRLSTWPHWKWKGENVLTDWLFALLVHFWSTKWLGILECSGGKLSNISFLQLSPTADKGTFQTKKLIYYQCKAKISTIPHTGTLCFWLRVKLSNLLRLFIVTSVHLSYFAVP